MNRRIKLSAVIKWLVLLLLVVGGVWCYLNRQWVVDWARGMNYQPTAEMAKIHDELSLTERGKFLFKATRPILNSRDEFNINCGGGKDEVAVLGCYTGGVVYIYNITNKELDGIREVTTAHELLHAVFARMTDDEKEVLRASLEKVYQENLAVFQKDLETYPDVQRFEELYVRAGTEVKDLPDDLEKHYAEIFKDQDKVVSFYDKYIKVFRQLEEELDNLEREMEKIAKQVKTDTASYERQVEELNSKINEFNRCADMIGCFESEYLFNLRRSELMAEQGVLDNLYNQINDLIDEYNAKVEKYNADVLRTEELNEMINSNSKPKDI